VSQYMSVSFYTVPIILILAESKTLAGDHNFRQFISFKTK